MSAFGPSTGACADWSGWRRRSLTEEVARLSRVYLVRHGQAGTRKAYDSLSDLGRRQAQTAG